MTTTTKRKAVSQESIDKDIMDLNTELVKIKVEKNELKKR